MKKKFSPNFVWGFSLIEMMIVLLIISIIMAATAPIISKRAKATSTSPLWARSSTNPNNIFNKDNGNVGIGTNNPATKLEVKGWIYTNEGSLRVDRSGETGGSVILGDKDKSTGADGIARTWEIFNMTGVYGNSLQFWAYDLQGQNSNCTSGMCSARFKLYDAGNAWLSGTLTQSSDARLKKDIKTLDNPYEKLLGVRGVNFKWKNKHSDKKEQYGFIAQEVEKVFPDLVSQSGKYKDLNYIGFIPILVEAIKTQDKMIKEAFDKITAIDLKTNEKIDLQQKQIEAQQAQIVELMQKFDKLAKQKH